MRISHQKKFVFLALPRTGSVSMRRLLNPDSDICSVEEGEVTPDHPFYNHIPAKALRDIFDDRGWNWNEYTRFCVVRNPYDRMVSLYHFRQKLFREVKRSGWRGWWRKRFSSEPSFAEFVRSLDPTRRMSTTLGGFINDQDGKPLVNQILRFEDLQKDLPPFLDDLGVSMPEQGMPHLNSSSQRRDYRAYYDEASRQRVADLYCDEIESFGYEF